MTARSGARAGNDTATRLVEVAARLLATQGQAAVSARRVTAEAGMSTMAVYTHFGGMDALLAEVWREGFARFGAELDRPALTADPVADWMAQGWAYRHFARSEPDLYRVMFGEGLLSFKSGSDLDREAALATFGSLVKHLERCRDAGRFAIADLQTAGEVVWAAVHGMAMIELTGYQRAAGRDPVSTFEELLRWGAAGFGDKPALAQASLAKARRRAKRAGQLP